jgi:lactate dehydrogenase-like 2-hydroxyacid dehydrogenase
MKIVCLERDSIGKDIDFSGFEELGSLSISDRAPGSPEELKERLKGFDAVLSNKIRLNEETLSGTGIRVIIEMATGYDNIDLDYCRAHEIAVFNAGHYSTDACAQHTFALALALMGKVPYFDRYVKSGGYSASGNFTDLTHPVIEVAGKTWGIAGMGNIGRKVASIAKAFGADVITYATSGRPGTEYESVSFDEFLKRSDIISIHCPLTDRTHHLFDESAFHKMKKTAYLINVARGAVVDERALADAIIDDEIAGAGIDVHESEPIEADHPLLNIKDTDRLILTPHMAWASVEARQRDVDISAENLRAYLSGEKKNRIV